MRSRPKVSWVMQARAAIVAVGAAGLVACDPGTDGGPAGEVRDGATALAPASASAGDSWAEALVSRWIDALGGMQAFYDFRTARFTLTTELYDVETGRLQRTRPRYVALAKT